MEDRDLALETLSKKRGSHLRFMDRPYKVREPTFPSDYIWENKL